MKKIIFIIAILAVFAPQTSSAASVELSVDGKEKIVGVENGDVLYLDWKSEGAKFCNLFEHFNPENKKEATKSNYDLGPSGTIRVAVETDSIELDKDEELFLDYTIECHVDELSPKVASDSVSVVLIKNKNHLRITNFSDTNRVYTEKPYKLKWTSDKNVKKVDVVISKYKNGDFVDSEYLASSIKNTNSYTFTLPSDFAKGKYSIKVSEPTGGIERASDDTETFTVVNKSLKDKDDSKDTDDNDKGGDDSKDELTSEEKLEKVAELFGKDSELYRTVKFLIEVGVI